MGLHWIKLTVIFGIIVGSLYVLAPTVAENSGSGPNDTRSAEELGLGQTEAGPGLEARYSPVSGDIANLTTSARLRLEAAGIPLAGVVADQGELIVRLQPGGRHSDVAELLARDGVLHLVSVDDMVAYAVVSFDESETVSPPANELLSKAGISVPQFVAASKQPMSSLKKVTVTYKDGQIIGARPERMSLGAVLLNGQVIAVSKSLGAEVGGFTPLAELEPQTLAVLTSGPLGGSMKPSDTTTAEIREDGAADEVTEPIVPGWMLPYLPDTAMNLGLDLLGGVDLTLQIDLDAAVLARVGRDVTGIVQALENDGFSSVVVKRDRFEPALLIQTDKAMADLRNFFATNRRDYQYRDSPTNRDGELVHAFELREETRKDLEDQSVEQVLETLRERVDETGVKEPSIVKKGGGRINVQLPGKVDLEAALKAIGTTAVLEFRLVDEDFEEATLQRMITAAQDALPEEQFLHDQTLNNWLHDTGRLAEDRLVMWQYEKDAETKVDKRTFPIPLKQQVILTGSDVNGATVSWDRNQQPYVGLEFKPQGAAVFCTVTEENVRKRFAIILDGKIRSAPSIRERICGGSASIEMGGSVDAVNDARNLSLVLRTGSLTAPVSIGEIRTIGSTLGDDSIRSGAIGAAVGSVLVLFFMGMWYRRAGMVANVALAINVLMVFATLGLFGATLTLPGIAGVALTVGMAVDANIIIFERIREEVRLGQQIRKAVEVGFEKASVAVIDANITTAIAGIVLYSFGTGPIKGFAVTLLIGIGTTLVTALFVTRSLLEWLTRSSSTRFRI